MIYVVDTETSGLPGEEDAHVVEIAVVTVEIGRGIVSTYTSLVRPPVLTEAGLELCRKVSGITEEMLEDAPRADEVWRDVQKILHGGGETTAWNIGFDRTMIRKTFMGLDELGWITENMGELAKTAAIHSKYGWPEHIAMDGDKVQWGPCAMWEYARLCPVVRGTHKRPLGGPWHNNAWRLSDAANREGVAFEGDAHRALADAIVTAKIVHKMKRGDLCATSQS